MFQRILIAYDGSEEAEQALSEGIKLASISHAHLEIAACRGPLLGLYNSEDGTHVTATNDRHRLTVLMSLLRRAARLGVENQLSIDTVILETCDPEAVVDAARRDGSDLVLIGLKRRYDTTASRPVGRHRDAAPS